MRDYYINYLMSYLILENTTRATWLVIGTARIEWLDQKTLLVEPHSENIQFIREISGRRIVYTLQELRRTMQNDAPIGGRGKERNKENMQVD